MHNMNLQPLVSVLMTAYNREQLIGESIASVLASTYINFELIILDDCSVDNTVAVARNYESTDKRISVFVNLHNLGDYPNRNKAASYAKGKYIKYVDSDDIITSDGLAVMVQAMERFPEAVFGISQFNTEKNIDYPQLLSPESAYRQHYNGMELFRYGPVGAIFKKEIFDAVNGFNPTRYISDTALYLKLASHYPVIKLQPGLVEWRQHPQQEFNYGNDSFSYLRLTYPMDMHFLNDNCCPLNKEEIQRIQKRLQWKHARDILSLAFKKKQLKTALTIFNKSGLSWMQLLNGFKSYDAVKKYFVLNNRLT
jgi:glycosyltransferase involved in cell wall biosynthesis